jgi:hypothetical protein
MEKEATEIAKRHIKEHSTWEKALAELNAIAPSDTEPVSA